MSHPIVLKYALDPTGVSPLNRVTDEPHETGTRRYRIIVPSHGLFYKDSVTVIDSRTNQPLTKNDFEAVEYQPHPSVLFGKEICSVILIKNQAIIGDRFKINYQAVGGEFSYASDAIKRLYEDVMNDDRPIDWNNILGKDELFNPLDHLHDVGDFYGAEGIVFALESIRRAILIGDSASHDEIYRYIDELEESFNNGLGNLENRLRLHIEDKNNPHEVDKYDVELGNIPNSITHERLLDSDDSLLTAKAMHDHIKGNDHDDRYLIRDPTSPQIQMRWRAGKLEIKPAGEANWIQVYPPIWG